MLQVALRRSRGKNCLSSVTLNLETVRVSKLRKGHYYIQATQDRFIPIMKRSSIDNSCIELKYRKLAVPYRFSIDYRYTL